MKYRIDDRLLRTALQADSSKKPKDLEEKSTVLENWLRLRKLYLP